MTAKARRILIHILWLTAAVLLAAAGIGCLFNHSDIMSMLADWIGIPVCSRWRWLG